jgi:hypothetical protein
VDDLRKDDQEPDTTGVKNQVHGHALIIPDLASGENPSLSLRGHRACPSLHTDFTTTALPGPSTPGRMPW